MSCNKTRKLFLARELGATGPHDERQLAAHTDACASCRTWIAEQRALASLLAELRAETAGPLDVTARVAAGLAAIDPPRGPGESPRQLGWAAAAALACGVGLAAGLWALVPELLRLGERAIVLARGAGGAASGLLVPVATVLTAAGRLAGRLLLSAAALPGRLAELEPLGIATISTCFVMMTTMIVLVVGRDLRREPEDHRS